MEDKEIYRKMDRYLERRRRQLIGEAVALVLRFIIETAVIAVIAWLCIKQCS